MSNSTTNTLDNIYPCNNHSKIKKKKRDIPHIQHELNVVKSILQETSSVTGDNMYVNEIASFYLKIIHSI